LASSPVHAAGYGAAQPGGSGGRAGADEPTENPEKGILRVSVSGDRTNAGAMSAHVSILSSTGPVPQFPAHGEISQRQTFSVPGHDPWRRSPLDLILMGPSDAVLDRVSLNNLQTVLVANPVPGGSLP